MTVSRRALLAGLGAGLFAAPFVSSVGRAQGQVLSLYTARHYDTDEALYTGFTQATGIRIQRVDAPADQLIERLRAEGAGSPADVFITVDAGRIERAKELGLLQPSASALLRERVPEHLRDPDGTWFGFSVRARVLIHARDRVSASDLDSYEQLAEPKWKGRVLTRSSSNIYSQSLTGSMLAAHGPAKTEEWCRGLVANLARAPRGGDTDQIRAVAAGEGDVAISNTYYLGQLTKSAKADDRAVAAKVAVFFPNQRDRGTHVNISGGGIARHAKNREAAQAFLEYLTTAAAQEYFADGNMEFPVVGEAKVNPILAAWGNFKQDRLNAGVFARNNAEALRIMERAGWR
jgi:iron(III) transport system substrate-binding protein